MNQITFTIPGPPRGKQRARTVRNRHTGRVMSFTPDETTKYEDLVRWSFVDATRRGPDLSFDHDNRKRIDDPHDGPIEMEITAVYPIPASWSERRKGSALSGAIRPTVKPDLDNIVKIVADALNGLAYTDDSRVVEVIVRKRYGSNPRCEVKLTMNRG
jgi:Holliday junction resolvase RusA-like endonuclease